MFPNGRQCCQKSKLTIMLILLLLLMLMILQIHPFPTHDSTIPTKTSLNVTTEYNEDLTGQVHILDRIFSHGFMKRYLQLHFSIGFIVVILLIIGIKCYYGPKSKSSHMNREHNDSTMNLV